MVIYSLKSIKDKIECLKKQCTENIFEISEFKVKIDEQIAECEQNLVLCEKMKEEILKMKKGRIALIGQITTISKIRIHDPVHSNDVLTNIRVSNETLDKIDDAISEMYIKK